MLTTLRTFVLDGISARPARVEVDVHRGVPGFVFAGTSDTRSRDTRERIRAAVVNSGFDFPQQRVVALVAPAAFRRPPSSLDLPISAAMLAASGQLDLGRLKDVAFVGELALDGSLRAIDGALVAAEEAKRFGAATIVVPSANGPEAALVDGIDVVALDHLADLPRRISDRPEEARPKALPLGLDPPSGSPDLADLRGQPELRRALELAAAGGHSMLMIGPPGSGKAMAAARLPSILPPLRFDEALEVARIASASGRLDRGGWRGGRPFRAPHHTISTAGLVGGGLPQRPGEATLAHRGVLLLEQVEEFRREALEALCIPLNCGEVTVTRAGNRRPFPARFQLLAGANPCPCGRGAADRDCPCSPQNVERHRGRIASALGAQVEIQLAIRKPSLEAISGPPGESSALVADRVCCARDLQERRLGAGRSNAQMTPEEARSCPLHSDAALLLAELTAKGRLGIHAQDTALRLAQTIADLDEASPVVAERHLTEALRLLPSTASNTAG